MKAQVYLRPVHPLTPEQNVRFNQHCEKLGALPVPAGVDVLVPEFDRAGATSRRQSAVELLLSDGYTWADGKWKRPPNEAQQKCVQWNTYWRASDAHGVKLSVAQALELLRDALGVEVAIDLDMFTNPVHLWFAAWSESFGDNNAANGYTRKERDAVYDYMLQIIKEARG